MSSSWLYLGKTLIFGKKSSSNQGKSTLLWNHFRLCLATYVTEILKGPKNSLWTPPGWLTATRNPSCKDCNVTMPQCPNSLNDEKTQTSMGGRKKGGLDIMQIYKEVCQKTGGWCFWGNVDIPKHTMAPKMQMIKAYFLRDCHRTLLLILSKFKKIYLLLATPKP